MVASTEHGKPLFNRSERISALEREAETERRHLATKANKEELRGDIKSLKWQFALVVAVLQVVVSLGIRHLL